MKTKLFPILFATMIFYSCSQNDWMVGSEEMGTVIVEPESFNRVNHQVTFPVYISYGDTEKLELTGNSNLLDFIDLSVENNTLHIRYREGHSYSNVNMALTIQVPELRQLNVNSSGDAYLLSSFQTSSMAIRTESSGGVMGTEKLTCTSLSLEVGLSGDIDLDVEVDQILVKAEGSARVQLGGIANSSDIQLLQSASFEAPTLICQQMNLNHNSTANAEVHVTDRLEGILASTGDVLLHGDPLLDLIITSTGRLFTIP